MSDVQTITPAELARRIRSGEKLALLDVREPHEVEICRIEGSLAMPMTEIAVRLGELDPDAPIVCICHHGIRSAHVAAMLVHMDFARVYNLGGGIDRWAAEVDPSMARYGR